MTIKEFLNDGHEISDLKIRTYVPIVEKARHINAYIEQSILQEDEGNMMVSYNSIQVEIARKLSTITLYTDLQLSDGDDYDSLMQSGLMDKIIEAIGDDYETYQKFFSMRMDDYIRNKNGVDGIIGRIAKAIEDIDVDKLNTLLSKIK